MIASKVSNLIVHLFAVGRHRFSTNRPFFVVCCAVCAGVYPSRAFVPDLEEDPDFGEDE